MKGISPLKISWKLFGCSPRTKENDLLLTFFFGPSVYYILILMYRVLNRKEVLDPVLLARKDNRLNLFLDVCNVKVKSFISLPFFFNYLFYIIALEKLGFKIFLARTFSDSLKIFTTKVFQK